MSRNALGTVRRTKSMEISFETKLARTQSVLASELDDQVVMMDINQGAYFSMKGTSFRVWELTKEPTTVGSIYQALLDEYEVDPAQCQQELFTLLAELKKSELIDFVDA